MYENYRMPGEFEKRSNVYVTWLPDYIRAEGFDNRQPCVDVIKALLEYGDVTVNLNCGTPGSYEEACSRLKEEGVDLDRIQITQFEDSNFYVRDNGPSIMVDDEGHSYMVNPAWTYYGVWDKNSPECQSARRAAVHMAVALGCFDVVNSEMVSEGGDREFDGHGTLIAIEDTECRKRNPEFSKEEVEAEYKRIYNLNKVIWLPQPMLEDDDYRLGILDEKEDGTPVFGMSFAAHIDEMCRFITPNKILLAEVSDRRPPRARRARNRVVASTPPTRFYAPRRTGRASPSKSSACPLPSRSRLSSPPATRTTSCIRASSTKWAASSWMAPLGPKAPFIFMPQQATATSSSATASFLASVITTKA